MLNHILVPLDGSQLAEDALEHAKQLIDPNGKITLVGAVDVPEAPIYGYYPTAVMPDLESARRDMLPQARTYLETIAKRLSDDHLTIGIYAQIGEPADVIAAAAEKFQVDAIVMSTHGRSGITRWLLGSVTSKVVGAKVCPVYVVPSKIKQNGHAA
jgi:nucleotide-binding universal stress UspA family protein